VERGIRKSVAALLVFAVMVVFASGLCAEEKQKSAAVQSAQVNINKASLEELSELKGIGSKYAERIIEYRQQHGPFKQVEDLANVPGIGSKTIEANKGVLTVN
jgi:competence protein ComEA